MTHQCPSCGDVFDTEKGLSIHLGRKQDCVVELQRRVQGVDDPPGVRPFSEPDRLATIRTPSEIPVGLMGGIQHDIPTLHRACTPVPICNTPVKPTTPGLFVRQFPDAGLGFPGTFTPYAIQQEVTRDSGMLWYPMQSAYEWRFAKFLFKSGLSNAWINEALDIGMLLPTGEKEAGRYIPPAFPNTYYFNKTLQMLPASSQWMASELDLDAADDDGDPLVLYHRDPVECVRRLLRKPEFKNELVYAPQKEFTNETEAHRLYGEMWTCDWWWDTQRCIPNGATLIPVIIASDKTNLTTLSGGKQAYPVYITIGNIPSALRRKEITGATEVLAYLPVAKFPGYSPSERQVLTRKLFHQAMAKALKPLRLAGESGVELECSDGLVRRGHPIYSTHLADHQEQLQIGCTKGCRCPMCQAALKSLGILAEYLPRLAPETAEAIMKGTDFNLNAVSVPYWATLPLVRLETLFPPDILHQLLKGMFKDHIFAWCVAAIGDKEEVDRRFKALPHFAGLKHFRNGVTKGSQWTGNEFRSMIRVFLGVIINAPNITRKTIMAVRSFLDFVFTAHYDYHDDASLQTLESCLRRFHSLKDEFVNIGGRTAGTETAEEDELEEDQAATAEDNSWIIPKLHAMSHVVPLAKVQGPPAHFSTDQSEHMHIQAAKVPYRKSNRRNFMAQVVNRLDLSERICDRDDYFQWRQTTGNLPTTDGTSRDPPHNQDTEFPPSNDLDPATGSECEDNPEEEAQPNQEQQDGLNVTGGHESDEEYDANDLATHCLPKRPTRQQIPIFELGRDRGGLDLHRQLQLYYMQSRSPTATAHRYVGYELEPLPFSHVALFKQFQVNLPAPPYEPNTKIKLTAKADPAGGQKVRRRVTPFYSAVLVDEKGHGELSNGIKGLRCGIVRAIMRIPAPKGYGEADVAYVDWFTRFNSQSYDEASKMYRVKKAYRLGSAERDSAIVEVASIRRPCYLSPDFGDRIPLEWRAWNVMEMAESFYICSFIDQDMYQRMC